MEEPPTVSVDVVKETEAFVKRMYDPNFGSEVSHISTQLVTIQQSAEAWQIAVHLLSSDDAAVRYYGANSLALKLDSEGANLEESWSEWIRIALVSSLKLFVSNGEIMRNTKRLSQALAIFFGQTVAENQNCVRQVLCSLYDERPVSSEKTANYPPTQEIVHQLGPESLLCSLWFCSELVVYGTTSEQSYNRGKRNEMLRCNIQDIQCVLMQSFDRANRDDAKETLRKNALQSFLMVAKFAIEDCPTDTDNHEKVRELIRPALSCVPDEVPDADIIWADLITQVPVLLHKEHKDLFIQLFTSQWSQEKLRELQRGEHDNLQYAELILAYIEATSREILKSPEAPASHTLLEIMHFFLSAPGVAIDEDELVGLATETWASLTEEISDALFEDDSIESETWLTVAKKHILQAIFELQKKIRMPPAEIMREWDSDNKTAFNHFRADVRDLMQSAFTFLTRALLHNLVERTLDSLKREEWEEIESLLFCLNSITDHVSEDSSYDDIISLVLSSPLFSDMTTNTAIPHPAKRMAVELIGNYSEAFKRHTQFLPNALNYLFSLLQAPKLCQQSAKSIYLLCSSCRKSLLPELQTFMQQYQNIASSSSMDVSSKGKVIGGVSAIIQTVPEPQMLAQYLSWLLDTVENDVQSMLSSLVAFDLEEGLRKAHVALECLINMAKALQDPEDNIISLEEAVDTTDSGDFWVSGDGHVIQHRVAKCIDDISISCREDSESIEKICTFLRIGYKETKPGPFVLDATVTVTVVSRCGVDLPRLPLVLSTAGICLSKHWRKKDPQFEDVARELFNHVLGILSEVRNPSQNPEVSESCIEFLSSTLHHHSKVLISLPPSTLEELFFFVIQCIKGADILPKRAACVFWADLIKITKDPTSPLHDTAQEVFNHFATALCDTLIGGICGDAASSTLEYLASPLSQIITSQKQARALIENSLSQQNIGGPSMDPEKRKFFQALMSTRTSIPRRVLHDFWNKCRQARLQDGVRMQQENARGAGISATVV